MKSLRGAAAVCGSCRPVLCPTHGPQNRRAARAGVPAWCGASALSAWLRASFPAAFLKRHIQGRTLHHGRRLEDTGAAADRAGAGNACGRPVGAAPEPRKRAFQNPPARPAGWWSVFLPAWQRIALQADAVSLYRWRVLRGMVCYFSLSVPSFWAVGFGAVLRLGRRDRRG